MNESVGSETSVVEAIFLYGFLKFILIFVFLVTVVLMLLGLYHKNTNRMCKSKKMLFGKTVLVSGGTTGIGLEVANDMAHRGAKVIITCPFTDEGLKAKKHIEESSGSDKVSFKLIDLSSLQSVRQFASDILKSEDRLDILINNAGTGMPSQEPTADGLHRIMQVNYFGAFLLTVLLLPLLKKAGEPSEPSRIVNISSIQHRVGRVEYKNWNNGDHYNTMYMYSNSKLCLVIFSRILSKMLKDANVVVNVVDPGAVGGTNIFLSFGKILGCLMSRICTVLMKNTWEGAQTVLYVSLSDKAGQVSGEYFSNCQIISPAKAVYDEDIENSLWNETAKVVKLKDEEWNYDYAQKKLD